MVFKSDLFTSDILQSCFAFERFLSGEKEIQYISQQGQKPYVKSVLYNRWNVVCLVVTYPLKLLTSLFWSCVSSICKYLNYNETAIRCSLKAAFWMQKAYRLDIFLQYQENYLATSHNVHRLDSEDFYLTEPIKRSSISDKRVEELLSANNESVQFQHFSGVCRGMSQWFMHLYRETQGKFSARERQLIEITKLFEEGAPRQAALIQSFPGYSKRSEGLIGPLGHFATNVFTKERYTLQEQSRQIDNLGKGIFGLCIHDHEMVYIRENQNTGYIYDPNYGLIRTEGDQAAQIQDFIENWYDRPYYFERFHPVIELNSLTPRVSVA